MKDDYGRTIDYMRVSVTDRCNLRCRYCMPRGIRKMPMSEILSYESILQICTAAVGIGITKFKVTGGEPFARLGCTDFIRNLKGIPGVEQVTVTTNGMLLEKEIPALKRVGIDGVNVSLDSLRPDRFSYITGGGDLQTVLRAIREAVRAGLNVKVNCLVQRYFNEDEVLSFAELAQKAGIRIRFIEMMPIGAGNPERGVSNLQILQELKREFPALREDPRQHGNGPAVYYAVPGLPGGFGFISAIHHAFCSSCNRLRLTAEGKIKPCLCYNTAVDIKPFLNQGIPGVQKALRQAVMEKPRQHCFNDDAAGITEQNLMAEIGG